LTQQEIQQRIDAKMPYTTKKYDITVNNATIDLSSDKLTVAVAGETKKVGVDLSVSGSTTGTIRYERKEGEERGVFFFSPESIMLAGAEVKGHKLSPRMIALTQKGLDGKLLEAAQYAFEKIPVYRLPDTFKGHVASISITKVEVVNNSVVVHLSFWNLTKLVFVYALVAVLAVILAIAMMMNPELFLAVAVLGSLGGD
jgi:hypothetical protein